MTTDQEPEPLGAITAKATQALQHVRPPSMSKCELSPTGHRETMTRSSRAQFAVSMARLCHLKRTATLSENELAAWHGLLGIFPPAILDGAILQMAMSETRFPEVGDLYQIARARAIRAGLMKTPYSPHAGTTDAKVTEQEIAAIAERMGVKIQ